MLLNFGAGRRKIFTQSGKCQSLGRNAETGGLWPDQEEIFASCQAG